MDTECREKNKMKEKINQLKKLDIINIIVTNRKIVERAFIIAVIVSAICACFVEVNYDLSEYLPDSASSKAGLNLMEEEFGYPGTARVMIGPVTLYEAKIYKDKIAAIDGIDMVMWADTTTDIYKANIFIDYDNIEDYYKDNYAVMDITFDEGDSGRMTKQAIREMQKVVGDKGYYTGSAVQNKSLNETLTREIAIAMLMAVVMIAVVLCITTTSWFEPVLFLLIMGIAIIINMGTNLLIGRISFLTFSVAAILQLAVAMDYSVFLLHTFTREKANNVSAEKAVENAIRNSVTSILSSGATTIIGFIVLMLMKFSIGKDMGFVLAKGIVISLITVLVLMPALLLRWGDRIEKASHRSFMPPFRKLGNFVYKVRYPVIIITALLVTPAYVAQNMNKFTFGNSALGSSPGTKVYDDEQQINTRFGRSNLLLAIVPNANMVTEKALTDELDDLYYTKSVTSLAGVLPEGIPLSILPESAKSLMHTENYSRILIYIRTADESDFAFQCTNEIRDIMNKHYPQGAFLTGLTPSTEDIKDTITKDYNFVSILSAIGVALVVMITFKSLIIPLIVIIPIEVAIFFNMSLPYFTGETLLYMGYIIVSCIQLGATVDYSILMTNNYIDSRREYSEKGRAVKHTVSRSALAIFTSGAILIIVGYGLYFTSTVSAIAGIGHLVGRGALISLILVLFLLPGLLVLADGIIIKQKIEENEGVDTDEVEKIEK